MAPHSLDNNLAGERQVGMLDRLYLLGSWKCTCGSARHSSCLLSLSQPTISPRPPSREVIQLVLVVVRQYGSEVYGVRTSGSFSLDVGLFSNATWTRPMTESASLAAG